MPNPAEVWKADKHGFDVWPDVLRHAAAGTPMTGIASPDLERMKWHGFFYRKRDEPGRYMNRIRITANELTSEQARTIALLAYEYGHGIVDVTTRANVQIQGLDISRVPTVADRLAAVGLTSKQTGHDNVRNVFGHPFSGVLPTELIDTRALCRDVTNVFIDNRDYADLPRKLNICLNGTGEHSAHFWTQDLSFLACLVEREVFFQVLVGGTQGQNPHLAWHLPVLVHPDQVVTVTRTVLDLFRGQGSRADRHKTRLRYLIERIGIDGVLEYLTDRVALRPWPGDQTPAPASQYDDLVGWFSQRKPELWTMGLCIPLGRLSWNQLEAVALLSNRWGNGLLRTTHEQGLAVIDIPTGFKDAAATDAAAVGLSMHADTLARNTVACTGTQFCNIAVTETKGRMFRLIDTLRQRSLALHGIRIHMSGCPSSCAQHFTADIGLKGVRVRRLIGTREGFDVYLGGGVAGDVHLGLRYKLGVDVDQLSLVIEEVVKEYYLKRQPGVTFSAYWRARLREAEAAKVGDEDYTPSVWICERCDHRHRGEDPPVFCPTCAGVRRLFARVDTQAPAEATAVSTTSVPDRDDGFVAVANEDAVQEGSGTAIELDGHAYALFKTNNTVHAIDGLCPHEGGPLGEGAVADGVVTCPWHGWTFDACTGCSRDPVGHTVERYETLVEGRHVYLKPKTSHDLVTRMSTTGVQGPAPRPATATLEVIEIHDETPNVRTFRLDNTGGQIPHEYPGTFVRICVPIDGVDTWRSFTVCSSPTDARFLDLTIKRNPDGQVTNYLFDTIGPGCSLTVQGAQGRFFFDPARHREPLVLISAGSGITPVMSIARFLAAIARERPCTFLYGARTVADIIFWTECLRLHETLPSFTYDVTLSQPDSQWDGGRGRLDVARALTHVKDAAASRYFLCGPHAFLDTFQQGLARAGVPLDRVHTEQFHATRDTAVAR